MSSSIPTPKRTERGGRKRLANPENQPSDEQSHVDIQQDFSQKLDALLHVVTDLSMRVAAYEGQQYHGEASVTASPPTSPPRRRVRCQVTHVPYFEIAPEVCRHVADSLRRATPLNTDTDHLSEDDEHPPPRKKEQHEVRNREEKIARRVGHPPPFPHQWQGPP